MRSRTCDTGSAPFWYGPTTRRENGNPPPIRSWHARDHVTPVHVLSREGHVHAGTLHLELRVAVKWRRPRFSGNTPRGAAAFHTRQIKEVPLWTGITPRLKRVCGCLIPCSPPRFRLAAGRAAPHRFRLAASRIPTTRARGQGLTLPPGAAERAASPRVAQLVVAPVPAGPSPESDIGRSPALAVTRARLRPPAPAHSGPATPTLRPRRRRSDHRHRPVSLVGLCR
jgi:hypothetical protein